MEWVTSQIQNHKTMIESIKDIENWLNDSSNKKIILESRENRIKELLSHNLNFDSCVRIASRIEAVNAWWKGQVLYDLHYKKNDLIRSASRFLDSSFYFCKILISSIDTPDAGARISANELQKVFFMLLSFNRYEQALWLGGRTYLGDTPERFNGRNDEVWTLREVSEWESLGGDLHGWGSIVAKLRRLIPGQAAKECSAGRLPDDPMFPYWEEKPLCGYMLRLWLVMSGQIEPEQIPQGHPACGVYEGLFTNWNDLVALESSIREALDYHVRRSVEHRDSDIPEFTMRPYNVIPFEILAYRNVRKRMGLETPMPSHPLLESPFVRNLPEELPPSEDPLLLEVLAAVRKVLPDV